MNEYQVKTSFFIYFLSLFHGCFCSLPLGGLTLSPAMSKLSSFARSCCFITGSWKVHAHSFSLMQVDLTSNFLNVSHPLYYWCRFNRCLFFLDYFLCTYTSFYNLIKLNFMLYFVPPQTILYFLCTSAFDLLICNSFFSGQQIEIA